MSKKFQITHESVPAYTLYRFCENNEVRKGENPLKKRESNWRKE